MTSTWTIERVKAELPSIPMLYEGKTVVCLLGGRLNAFASVFVPGVPGVRADYSWQTVTDALNAGRPLRW